MAVNVLSQRWRFAIAVLLPLPTLAIQLAVWPWIEPYAFILFLPAVFLSSRLGGRIAGFVSTAISAAMVWFFFLPPRYSFGIDSQNAVWSLIAYVAAGLIIADISGRLAQSRALALTERDESESKFATVVEQSLAGIYIVQDDMVKYANPYLAQILGYSKPAEIIGKLSLTNIIAVKDANAGEKLSALATGVPPATDTTTKAKKRDGSLLDVELHSSPVELEGRAAVMGIVVDITERKAAEAADAQRAARTLLLKEIAEIGSSSLDSSATASLQVERLMDALGTTTAFVFGLDDTSQHLVPIALAGVAPDYIDRHFGPVDIDGPGTSAQVYRTGEPAFVRDVLTDPFLSEEGRAFTLELGQHSGASLPLRARGEQLGVVSLGWPSARTLDEEEVSFLESVASELALGLQNARLFEAERTARQRTSLELETTTLLLGTANALATSVDLTDSLDRLGSILVDSSRHGRVTISLLDEAKGELRTVVSKGVAPMPLSTFLVDESSAQAREVIATGKSVVFDYDELPEGKTAQLARERQARLALVTPITYQNRVLGLIVVDSPGEHRAFELREIERLEAVGSQAGVAIENARLFAAEQLELTRTTVLKEIAALGASTIDPRALAGQALATLQRMLGATTGNLFLLDKENAVLRSIASFGFPRDVLAEYHDVPLDADTISTRVALSGELATHDQPSDDSSAERVTRVTGTESGGWIILPVLARDVAIGTLGLSFPTAETFAPSDLAFYQGIAGQLGVALERAELFTDLAESQRQVVGVLESTSDGYYALDREWRFTYANAEAGRMIGVPPGELIGHTIGEVLGDPEVQEFQERAFAPAMGGHEVVEFERYFPQTEIWADIRVFPSNEGVAVYGRDITERRVAEAARAETEQRFERLFDSLLEGVAHCEMYFDDAGEPVDWRYLDVNPAFALITGLEGIAGRLVSEAIPGIKESNPELFTIYGEVARTGEPVEFDAYVPVLQRGQWLHIGVTSPAKNQFVAVFNDITERKEAELAVQELNATLERRVEQRTAEVVAANKELESFAYAVSHDLRAPLRAMSGFSQALVEDYGDKLDETADEYLDHIVAGSRRMGALIDAILILSRATRGGLERQQIDVSAEAQNILAEMAAANPERDVTWSLELGLVVEADPRMFDAALSNLLGNAWKYTEKTPKAHIDVSSCMRDGKRWICISDNGAGFDNKYAGQLFKPFQRLHTQDEFAGTGIGLATVQRIVDRHGGQIIAEGAVGHGATFMLWLPSAADGPPDETE